MDHGPVARAFTHPDGSYRFARWGRPIVPVVFGVEDVTLPVIKGAVEAVVALAGHRMSDRDPELGANLFIFFVREWGELDSVPDLDRLVPDLSSLLARLEKAEANRYRLFRFDEAGAIRAVFLFLCMDPALAEVPAEDIALSETVQAILLWSDDAFDGKGPLANVSGKVMLRPDVAAIVRAAYDPAMPEASTDPSHALRLAARIGHRGAKASST